MTGIRSSSLYRHFLQDQFATLPQITFACNRKVPFAKVEKDDELGATRY